MIKKLLVSSLALTMAISIATPSANAATKTTTIKDVPKTHKMYNDIQAMKKKGVMSTYSDGTFKPNKEVTRGQVISAISKSTKLKSVRKGKTFKDVSKSNANYKKVQAAYKAGLFNEKSKGKFDLNAKVSKAEMSKVLVKAFGMKTQKGYAFTDITSKNSYKYYISTLYAKGVTIEKSGKYSPNKAVTRAQFATLLNRSINPSKAIKPSKKLQKSPVKAKVQATSYSSPFKKKPSKTPPGAKLLKTEKFKTGVWKTYSYKKTISGGHKIKSVLVNNHVVVVEVQVKKEDYLLQYIRSNSKFGFLMLRPKISQNAIDDLYTIAEDFDVYLSGWY